MNTQPSLFWKTSQDCCRLTEDEIWQSFSGRCKTSGRLTSDGECWTHNGTEWPSAAVVCSLLSILEDDVPEKYYLSPKDCQGILRRAEKRGKKLPELLEAALVSVAGRQTPIG